MTTGETLEKLFGSKCSVRVVGAMIDRQEVNVSELVKITGMPHRSVVECARKLLDAGIIREKRFGRIRIYQLVGESKAAQLIAQLAEEVEQTYRTRSNTSG